jgi:hypothetical protein
MQPPASFQASLAKQSLLAATLSAQVLQNGMQTLSRIGRFRIVLGQFQNIFPVDVTIKSNKGLGAGRVQIDTQINSVTFTIEFVLKRSLHVSFSRLLFDKPRQCIDQGLELKCWPVCWGSKMASGHCVSAKTYVFGCCFGRGSLNGKGDMELTRLSSGQ